MGHLIMLTGTIGSGKSTAADYLTKCGFIDLSFANPLKQIGLIFGFEHHQLYGTQSQKLEINDVWKISGREFMQKFGTDICRDVLPEVIPQMKSDRSIWIQLMHKRISDIWKTNPNQNIVISDGRFYDEAEFVRSLDGVIIKLHRGQIQSSHKSETDIANMKVSFDIDNNQDLDHLHNQMNYILGIMQKYKKLNKDTVEILTTLS